MKPCNTLEGVQDKLPSKSREQLTGYFLFRLIKSKLTWDGRPSYNLGSAQQEIFEKFKGQSAWLEHAVQDCFHLALDYYMQQFPPEWDSVTNQGTRKGLQEARSELNLPVG